MIIPCQQNEQLHDDIERYAEVLKTQAHTLGDHGLDEREFYASGIFRGAIERIRGQFSADMREKREFVRLVLNHMQDGRFIGEWESSEAANRHDYTIALPSGRTAVIELKGCLDGNNTNIFERPANAQEFVVWSVCSNAGSDPERNVRSGMHTRLSAEIVSRGQRVDGVIVWDWVCGTYGRRCPKIGGDLGRLTELGPHRLPPPCIYVLPDTVPEPRNNPRAAAQDLDAVELLAAFHACFRGGDAEVNYVGFRVEARNADIHRATTVTRGGQQVLATKLTAIRRSR